jgi:ATP-dependent Lon protease
MTTDEKKQYLNQYKVCQQRVEAKAEELAKIRSIAAKITPAISDMPRSSGGNRLQESIEQLIKVETELNQSIFDMVRTKKRIERAINEVDDETLRTLLEYRYINGMTFESMALQMHYNDDGKNIYKLHRKALEKITLDTK